MKNIKYKINLIIILKKYDSMKNTMHPLKH